jgi:hypothetical protein
MKRQDPDQESFDERQVREIFDRAVALDAQRKSKWSLEELLSVGRELDIPEATVIEAVRQASIPESELESAPSPRTPALRLITVAAGGAAIALPSTIGDTSTLLSLLAAASVSVGLALDSDGPRSYSRYVLRNALMWLAFFITTSRGYGTDLGSMLIVTTPPVVAGLAAMALFRWDKTRNTDKKKEPGSSGFTRVLRRIAAVFKSDEHSEHTQWRASLRSRNAWSALLARATFQQSS